MKKEINSLLFVKQISLLLGCSLLFVLISYRLLNGVSGGDLAFIFFNLVVQFFATVFVLSRIELRKSWILLLLNLSVTFSIVFYLAPFEW